MTKKGRVPRPFLNIDLLPIMCYNFEKTKVRAKGNEAAVKHARDKHS